MKKNVPLLFLSMFLMLFTGSSALGQQIYYVATSNNNGNNTNNGLSEATPWQTISYAIDQVKLLYQQDNVPNGGVEIRVRAGDYGNESLNFNTFNSMPITDDPAKPLKLIGYKTDGVTPQVNYEIDQDIRLASFYQEMPLLNGLNVSNDPAIYQTVGIDLNHQHYIEIHNFLITDYRQYGISCGASGKGLLIKNTIVTNIGSADCDGNGELDPETKEPLCGYGISLYGEAATIDSCIVTDAGAHNIEVWSDDNSRLGGNLIVDCKSYATEEVANTTGYFIAIRNSDNNKIQRCSVARAGNPKHQGHAIGVINGHHNLIEDCYVINSREGFYLRGDCMFNTFKNCEVIDTAGKYEAFQIRDGASYNQFINCKSVNAAISVRIQGSNFREVYANQGEVGIGTGHHNFFYNCQFIHSKVFIEFRKYTGCEECLMYETTPSIFYANACRENCENITQCQSCDLMEIDTSLAPIDTCLKYLSCTVCKTYKPRKEGSNYFVNCNFIGQDGFEDILIKNNQDSTKQNNQIINSIIYNVRHLRTHINGVPLNDQDNRCDDAVLTDLFFDFKNCLYQSEDAYFVEKLTTSNGNLAGNPLFVNPTSDYHLTCSSPAINAGIDPYNLLVAAYGDNFDLDLLALDYENSLRPLDCLFDIGNYELDLSQCPTTLMLNQNNLEGTYQAKNNIESTGTVPSGVHVIFKAGDYISLKPGFIAEQDCDFLATINACDNSNNTRSSVAQDNPTNRPNTPTPPNSPETTQYNFSVYPNPTNRFVTISFEVEQPSKVQLGFFNGMGQFIKELTPLDNVPKGKQEISLNIENYPPGAYWIILNVDGQTTTKKVMVVR